MTKRYVSLNVVNAPKSTKIEEAMQLDIHSRQHRYDVSSACGVHTSCRKDASRNRDSLEIIQKSVHWVQNYDKSGGLSLRFATSACVTYECKKQQQQHPSFSCKQVKLRTRLS
jgi:hypothetical protein